MVTLTIGTQSARSGELVNLPISLNTQGELIRSFRVNLSFNGAALLDPIAVAGPALPQGWSFSQNSPASGDLRFLALDLAGGAARPNGVVAQARFSVAPAAAEGLVAVAVALQEVVAEDGSSLLVTVANGGVQVTSAMTQLVSPPALLTVTQPPPPPPPPQPVRVAVAVSPSVAEIPVGGTQQFTATCAMSDGTSHDCTLEATWSSSNPLVATIAPGGLATAIGVGATEIRAAVPATAP